MSGWRINQQYLGCSASGGRQRLGGQSKDNSEYKKRVGLFPLGEVREGRGTILGPPCSAGMDGITTLEPTTRLAGGDTSSSTRGVLHLGAGGSWTVEKFECILSSQLKGSKVAILPCGKPARTARSTG